MGNATSAGLGSEAPHDERDIRSVGQNSDIRPDDIELAEEAKGSEVIHRKSNLDSKVPKFPNKSYSDAKRGAKSYISEDIPSFTLARKVGWEKVRDFQPNFTDLIGFLLNFSCLRESYLLIISTIAENRYCKLVR